MLRRLHPDQPDHFAFTPDNLSWAQSQIAKYPDGRQASAVIPLLWRAQEQEGWLTRPAIEEVAQLLDMAYIRVLEVASFYFMFQLQPIGKKAHIQICGTTSCMICGAEDLVSVCREKIAPVAHQISADGAFSWEEVECLGACANAPMAQIGKDYYEDLTAARLREIIDMIASDEVPVPGPQSGRVGAEPALGQTSLISEASDLHTQNASVDLATRYGDTLKRIDGSEGSNPGAIEKRNPSDAPRSNKSTGSTDEAVNTSRQRPAALSAPRDGQPDDLKLIKGIGPKLEALCHSLGFFHFDQVAQWTDAQIAWVDNNLEGFKGRVSRDKWVAQARILGSGGETAFSKRAK